MHIHTVCFRAIAVFAIAFLTLRTSPAEAAPDVLDRPIPEIHRALIISIDGLRSDVLLRANAPHLRDMYRNGAFTFWAKTTPMAVTLPSHVSMLTGVVPEAHAITWNAELPLSEPVYPASATIFQLAHRAGYSTAMVAGKSKFKVLDVPGSIDWKWLPLQITGEDREVGKAAIDILRAHKPELMFVHFPNVDTVGHAIGWGTDEQLAAVAQADEMVGELMTTLSDLKLDKETLVIVTADHGGAGRTHGADDPRSRAIPWIVTGPGVRKNFDLARMGRDYDVNTYDTFSTVAAVLGIEVRGHVDGKFVKAAFENQELLISTYQPTMQPGTRPVD